MDPYMNDPTANQFHHVPTTAHSSMGQRRSSSPRDQRSYTPYSNLFSGRGPPYPFYGGSPTVYLPPHKGADPRVGTQYQSSSSSRPPDLLSMSRSVEVTRAGPAQALSSIVPSPTSQVITSHRISDHAQAVQLDAVAAGSSRRFPNARPSSKPRSGPFRGSPRSTPSLIKAEAPTTLGATMSGNDCFSTAEEPVPYALTNHPIFSEDLKKACTPIRKVENPFATQKKASVVQATYGEYDIQRYRNDVASSFIGSQYPNSKLSSHSYPNGVKDLSGSRNEYPVVASSSQDKQGGALDLSIKSVRQPSDSSALPLNSSFGHSSLYLGKGAKQNMPYDYSCTELSAKRPAELCDSNAVRNKYLKVSHSPNPALPRQLEPSRDSHSSGGYSASKAVEQYDLRSAYETSSFAQAHTSLTMPFGRQAQSANSSGYFGEGISESGVSFTPPVSPRIRHGRMQEKDKPDQKVLEVEPYFPHARPSCKNPPYTSYPRPYSNVYDRGRLDELQKYNSQSSYGHSVSGYYPAFSIDKYQSGEATADNSIAFRPSTGTYGKPTGPYGKSTEVSIAAQLSYDNCLKSASQEQIYTDLKPCYLQQVKQEGSAITESKRQPKIEIASQPINLIEDNEISIEKTQNNTLSTETFVHKAGRHIEADIFHAKTELSVFEPNNIEGKNDTISESNQSNSPTAKILVDNLTEKVALGKRQENISEILEGKNNAASTETALIDCQTPTIHKVLKVKCQNVSNIDTIGQMDSCVEADASIRCSDLHTPKALSNKVETADGEKTQSDSSILTESYRQVTTSSNSKSMTDDMCNSSPSETKVNINVINTIPNVMEETIPSVATKASEYAAKIKQEIGIKSEAVINRAVISNKTKDLTNLNIVERDTSKNKVNFADINSLKEYSSPKELSHLSSRHDGHTLPFNDSNLNMRTPEVQPVLNLSLSTYQCGTVSRNSLEAASPSQNSQARDHCASLNKFSQGTSVSNYYDIKAQPITSIQEHSNDPHIISCSQSSFHYGQTDPLLRSKYAHSTYNTDAIPHDLKPGVSAHSKTTLVNKPECQSNLYKCSPSQDYVSHGSNKLSYSALTHAGHIDTSSNTISSEAKDVIISHSGGEALGNKSALPKQIPLAINPRVLSPWNSTVPHSIPQGNRKPAFGNTNQVSNDFLRATSPLIKDITDNEKKLRPPVSNYSHSSYSSQYQYHNHDPIHSSPFSTNTQLERPHSYGYDSKASAYASLSCTYTSESQGYKPYLSTPALENAVSAPHQYNSSSSTMNRTLLSPHSPPHPPPPRLESSHHQSLYYPAPYNADVSSRTIGDQYSRASPQFPVPVEAKYQSREYPPYTYKGPYGQQAASDRVSYPSPSSYYSHQPYNVGSSVRITEQQEYPKPGRLDYPHEHQRYSNFSQESAYMKERSTYPHTSYSHPSGSTSKEFHPDKSPSLPPAAHLPQTSVDYKSAPYDVLHQSSQNSTPYSHQYGEQKGYLQSSKANSQQNQSIASYHYATPKSSFQGFGNQGESATHRLDCHAGSYSSSYSRGYDDPAVSPMLRTQHTPFKHNATYGEISSQKAPLSTAQSEYEFKVEKAKVSADVRSSSVPAVGVSKNNNGRTISNPVQPLYSSWANYKTPHPDTLNKQLLKPRSLDTLQNTAIKYPSFKTDKDSVHQHNKLSTGGTPFVGRLPLPPVSTSKGVPSKEHASLSRSDNYLKGPLQNRQHLTTSPNQSAISKDKKVITSKEPASTDLDFNEAMVMFETDLNTNKDAITSKKSLILAKRYANKIDQMHSAEASGVIEEEIQSFDESESEAEPPCKFRGKFKSIKDKKVERLILTYASHSDDSATEMIADEDESDFEEELVREIQAKARKCRGKDKGSIFKDTPDDSDISSAERIMRSSKLKKETCRHRKDLSSNNSTDSSSDSSEESNSSDSSESVIRLKKKVDADSSSDSDNRKTRSTRSNRHATKELNSESTEKSKRVTRRRFRRNVQNLSELSEDEVKPKRLRSTTKDYSSNSDDNEMDIMCSSTDCDSKIGPEKRRRLLLESDSDDGSEKNVITSSGKNVIKKDPLDDDGILKKLESQRQLESVRPDVIEMKAWKRKTADQAAALLKYLPRTPIRHSWKRPVFSGIFKKGWQTELRRFKLETVRTPKQLVTIPPTPANIERKRGRGTAKGSMLGRQTKDPKDGLYSKTMMRRFFDKIVLLNGKDDESLSRASSSPFSTFTPTGLTPTPSVTPSMLVTGIGSRDSDKDSIASMRGASPPASDSATLRRRSIATTIIQKIQRHHLKNRGFEAPWLCKPRSVLKPRTKSVLTLPKSIDSQVTTSTSRSRKFLDVACIRSIFGDDPPADLLRSSVARLKKSPKRKKYFSPISSSTQSTSSTPSTPIGTDEVGNIVASRKRKMKKFRSGFDYIPRKKKKIKPIEELALRARKKVTARRRRLWPESTRDVATEVKTWVINKGLGETPLHRAARLQYHDVVIYCLESKEINVNARDNAGYTPLHEACNRGHLDVAQALCAFGAHVNAPGYGGMRPLHEACDNGHVQLVRLLLSFGADINLASYAGQSCVSLASDSQCGPFVMDFTNDLRGKKAKPWSFDGPARIFDLEEQGADFFSDEPLEDEPQDGDVMIFEMSENLLPDIYIVEGLPGRFVLLNELLDNLHFSYQDLVTNAGGIETVYLSRKEFRRKSHCCSSSGCDDSSLKHDAEVVLVKYTKRLQTLLGVEVVSVT